MDMTRARGSLIDPDATPYYHCMARCVRRAYLCGKDDFSGKNYEHRRQWVVGRLNELSSIFAIEVCAYAVMSNHYHTVLHINSEEAENWRCKEVLDRWTCLFSGPVLVQKFLAGEKLSRPERERVDAYAEEYRLRLKDVSWFMRCLNEHLAREANREDGCKGRFWEGRFKSQALLDEAALLTCMTYVDLNPIRARLAETPESSDYTSIRARIDQIKSVDAKKQPATLKSFRSQGQNPEKALPYILHDYLELVDWSGRAIRADKRGHIANNTPPILERLTIAPDEWLKTMSWNNRFYRAAGRVKAMKAYALRTGQQWVQGLDVCSRLYHAGKV